MKTEKQIAREMVIEIFIIIEEELIDRFYGVRRLESWEQSKELALLSVGNISRNMPYKIGHSSNETINWERVRKEINRL